MREYNPPPESSLPKLDRKAGRQIFDKEYSRDDKFVCATVPKDSSNPIDVRLRQLALLPQTGQLDIKTEFFDKWAAVLVGPVFNLKVIKGRIKDMYFNTRDVYIKQRNGVTWIVPFGRVLEISEREI